MRWQTFIEERTDAEYTSYLYNGKELDEETGLYYYGARYYDPRISMWYGGDPLAEKYSNISTYAYVANNPIKLVDPDGMQIDGYTVDKKGYVEYLNDDGGDQFDVLYSKENPSKSGIVIKDKSILPALTKLDESLIQKEYYGSMKKKGNKVMRDALQGSYSLTDNKQEAKKLFAYFSESTDVEWSLVGSKNGSFFLGTLHSNTQGPLPGLMPSGEDLKPQLNNYYTWTTDGYNTPDLIPIKGFESGNLIYDAHSHTGTNPSVDFVFSGPDIRRNKNLLSNNPGITIQLYMPNNPNTKWLTKRR